jgi:hypothetical protein
MSASERDAPPRDDAERIERQIEETRNHMTSTLTELERKLSARQITNDVFDALRDAMIGTGEGSRDMIDMVRRNPIPAALIGIGIGWMVFGTTRRARAAHADGEAARQPDGGARGSNGAGRGSRYAAQVGNRARALAGTAQQRAGAAMQENPLVLGALGLVLGAVIGAVLPTSRREREWLSEAQARVVDQAEALGREALERAREVADHAGRAAVEVVERELGLERDAPPKPH